MTLLTPDSLRAAYNYLNETPPFNRWNLPDGDEVEFRVVRDQRRFGWHWFDGNRHYIAVSRSCVQFTDTLIRTMAHELVHMREQQMGVSGPAHGQAFRRWAAQVCKHHGFDPGAF